MSYVRRLSVLSALLFLFAAFAVALASGHSVARGSARAASTTGMICAPPFLTLGSPEKVSCLVTVDSRTPPIPTGEVFFTATGGTIDRSCVLATEDGGHATCGITYRPTQIGVQTLTDRYPGDETHEGSEGSITIAVHEPSQPGGGSGSSSLEPPRTRLTRHPPKKTTKRVAVFAVASNEPGATFECALDEKPFKPCVSPVRKRVRPGAHKFQVRAVDAEGVKDPTAAVFRWRVIAPRA